MNSLNAVANSVITTKSSLSKVELIQIVSSMVHHLTPDPLSAVAPRCQNLERGGIVETTNEVSRVVKNSVWPAAGSIAGAAKRVKRRQSQQISSSRPSRWISLVTTAWQSLIVIRLQLVSRINNNSKSLRQYPDNSRFSKALPNENNSVTGEECPYLRPLHQQLQRNNAWLPPQLKAPMIISSDLHL